MPQFILKLPDESLTQKGTIVLKQATISKTSLTKLEGWGANARVDCLLDEPNHTSDVGQALADSGPKLGAISRGLGRSYGDCAINEDRLVLGMTRMDRFLAFDETTGVLTCEAGLSLQTIIEVFTPRGWFPMITPGTKFVTVGGCIANDVHGKAHHAQGSFLSCVDSMTILLASGEIVVASRDQNPDLFFATFGGVGLLGIILTATLRLRKIETTYFHQKSIRVNDLDGMLAALDENDHLFPYSVATLDVFARGARLGKGVLTVGDHARLSDLPPRLASDPLRVSGPPKLSLPFDLPDFTLNPLTMRIVNAAIQAIQAKASPFGHYETFFYPLDKIGKWNRGYGRRGFTQYQFVIPLEDGRRRLRKILETILSSGELPFLNVLKRLGKESGGILSFPKEGYTFAIDFPIRKDTAALLRRLDALVIEAGGRIYLGKDSYIDPESFRTMYPEIDQWLTIRAKYDPRGVFTSNLGRRIGLA
jgi:decaprenylphospho-beta-D-ribofuranose 2-oxidase